MWYRHIYLGIIIFTSCILLYYLRTRLSFKMISLSYEFFQINDNHHHIAIILARKPSDKVLRHLNVLVNAGVNAFVMCDNDPSKYINSTNRVLYVNDESLAYYGLTRNLVWDRVFVWLYNQSWIDYVWLMEEDVTWTNVHHMVNLFDKYAHNRTDLLSRNIIYKNNETLGWMWWPKTFLEIIPEKKWSGALNMLSRVSNRLIKAHQYYIHQLLNEKKRNASNHIDGNYYFQEFFIPTVAHLFNLTMSIYDHSNMDVSFIAINEDEIRKSLANGKQIFHPVKHDSQLLSNATL